MLLMIPRLMMIPLILPCLPYAVTKRVDVAFLTLFTSSSDLMKSSISVPLGYLTLRYCFVHVSIMPELRRIASH